MEHLDSQLTAEVDLINRAIRSLRRLHPAVSQRCAIREAIEALGRRRRRLLHEALIAGHRKQGRLSRDKHGVII